ncbi:MAG: CcmD family protein [Saprospiraceae bacterium]|nr:CcmD family protein [Saprospiraceae bacterium]
MTCIAFCLMGTVTWAASPVQDFFRSTGKIYVVFAVILSIFVGIILLLIRMERRINRIENQINPS